MSNFFEDLHKQGIKNIELTVRELQQLYVENKITFKQFQKILIDNFGVEYYVDLLKRTFEEIYADCPPAVLELTEKKIKK